MQAVVISEGSFDVRERADPVPRRGEVVVRVRAAGLNPADLQQARGVYPAPPGWPADIPGLEVAGEVIVVGEDVATVCPGDRVMALIGGGGHAEQIVVPAELLMTMPAGMSWIQGGGFVEIFSTGWDALVSQAEVEVGQRVLVTGAAGGVGTALIQLASLSGAEVVASVRSVDLHDKVRGLVPEGAPFQVITPDQEDACGPFDVIVELVGGRDCLRRVSLLRKRGKLLMVGVQAGAVAEMQLFELMVARATLIGTTIRARSLAERAILASSVATHVVPLFTQGRLTIPVEATYPLQEYDQAYRHLAASGKFGKVVMTM